MRPTLTALSILALALVLPLVPHAAFAAAPSASVAPVDTSVVSEMGADLPAFGQPAPITLAKPPESCSSEDSFLIVLFNQQCGGCAQACEDAGGRYVSSLWDRRDCYCFCCAV